MTNDKRGRPDPQAWIPPQDGILGAIDLQAKEMVFGCQQRIQQIQVQIGAIEMQKGQLLQQAQKISAEAQQTIDKEAERLGIPPGVPWQMGADGVARLAPPGGAPQAAPPQQQPPPQAAPPKPPAAPGPRPVVNLAEAPPAEEPPAAEEPPVENPAEEDSPPDEG